METKQIDREAEIANLRKFITNTTSEKVTIEERGENCYRVVFSENESMGLWTIDFFDINGFKLVHFGVIGSNLYVIFNVQGRRENKW